MKTVPLIASILAAGALGFALGWTTTPHAAGRATFSAAGSDLRSRATPVASSSHVSVAELAVRLRESKPDVKVVFMSGLPEAPGAIAAAFVQKPIDLGTLADVIERVLV